MPSGYTRLLPAEGPSFEPWVVPTEPVGIYHPVIDAPDDPLYTADEDFIQMMTLRSQLFLFFLFDVDKKGEKKLEI